MTTEWTFVLGGGGSTQGGPGQRQEAPPCPCLSLSLPVVSFAWLTCRRVSGELEGRGRRARTRMHFSRVMLRGRLSGSHPGDAGLGTALSPSDVT